MKYSKYTRVGARAENTFKLLQTSSKLHTQIYTHSNYHKILHGFIKYAKVITQKNQLISTEV